MTDLAPSAIAGNTIQQPGAGTLLSVLIPWMATPPSYGSLPAWWTPARDWQLQQTIEREAMWGAAVARTATKFAAHGYMVSDSEDSQRRVSAAQQLLKRADGGEGWVLFAEKVAQDLLLCDNGVFIRIRRADEETQVVKLKAQVQATEQEGRRFDEVKLTRAAGKIAGLYHLDSLRCTRTGNLAYPVRYQPVSGPPQLLRWDQVLMFADQPSPRAEMFGVGRCAASRAWLTISKLAAMEQMVYEFLTGTGANKLVMIQGIIETTLRSMIAAGVADAQAKGLMYYLGTILAAVPGDVPIEVKEIRLKELLAGFDAKAERDNAYLIYANAIGVPVQDIQPLSGQGLGTGTQTIILDEAGRGIGIAAFLKWWEQTVSDRVLPATTELEFVNEADMRDQKAKAEVAKLRADERAARISSGEINPAMARQIAVDAGDLARDLVASDATPGGQLADDEKPLNEVQPSPAAQALAAGLPTQPPENAQPTTKEPSADRRRAAALLVDDDVQRRAAALVREVRSRG